MAEIEEMHPGLPDAVLMDVQATGRLPEELANSIDTRIKLLMSANLSRSKRNSTLTEVCDYFLGRLLYLCSPAIIKYLLPYTCPAHRSCR